MGVSDQDHSNQEPKLPASYMPVAERNSETKSTTAAMKERRFKLGRRVTLSSHPSTVQLTPSNVQSLRSLQARYSHQCNEIYSNDPNLPPPLGAGGFAATTVTLVKHASHQVQPVPLRRTERRGRNQSIFLTLHF
jgi:hypothetical protein